jgi:hypothetical protein
MTIQLTLASQSHALLQLVREFAQGLECEVDDLTAPRTDLRVRLPAEAGADLLLHLLSYVALSAVKLGVDAREPQYRVWFREPKAAAAVTLAFNISAIDFGEPSETAARTSP